MRRYCLSLVLVFVGALQVCAAQEVIDRVVARVEGDVILLSEVQLLSRYQRLVDGKAESDAAILDRLIDQWLVRNEAETAHFPHPTDAQIARGVQRVRDSFASPQEFQEREKQCALSDSDIRYMVAAQVYLSDYLDSRFRQSAQVDPQDVQEFYQTVVDRAKTRNQTPPSLEASREYIQQALMQRDINEQAARWLKESRSRVHIEIYLDKNTK